jgi:hypothetical protein
MTKWKLKCTTHGQKQLKRLKWRWLAQVNNASAEWLPVPMAMMRIGVAIIILSQHAQSLGLGWCVFAKVSRGDILL